MSEINKRRVLFTPVFLFSNLPNHLSAIYLKDDQIVVSMLYFSISQADFFFGFL
ncbi:hypothetical protein JYB64_19640 [Algoriphagus aestuarii]|nr:hypothetical protein [Algoriphagus aestuarii]